ncbi:MAG: FIST C-terminal domain-containing protein [Candidatus Zambryskibacteria bacterium]|nr:FIST C-terminal domain-containing protein [Candidatus Zambryskibacteria bacterium]
MAIKASVGVNQGDDSYAVGANACQDAIEQLGDSSPDLLVVFSSVKYDQEKMLQGVRSVAPGALLVGSSTSGEITTQGPLREKSVAIMAIKSPEVKYFAGVGENIAANPREAGKVVADKVKRQVKEQAGETLKTFMMFPDVLAGNGADIVRGVLDSLGEHFPVVGGASGDDFAFKKTYQYVNDKVYSGAVVGLGLVGNFKMGIGVKHGWIPVGEPATVTKSAGSVIHEINGKPAIRIYEDYFGEEEAKVLRTETLAKLAITYPLGMKVVGSDELLIRDPITVDEHGSITCAAEIPEGSEIRLMVGSRNEAIQVARTAAKSALEQLGGSAPKAIIIFNCIARQKLFGDKSGDEIKAIQEIIGPQVPLIGFYTYGEQAPLGGEVKNIERCNSAFHNETVVICALAD